MKKSSSHMMEYGHESMKKSHHLKHDQMKHKAMHHSDPMVGGMSEDEGRVMGHGDFANMPQEVHFKHYPKANEFGPDVLDDTMGHVDTTNKHAHNQSRKYLSNQH